ncbi:MAG: FKBP-type peptidyl-prolyl cis-trans isomerase [Bacteroidota bacterium]|jgi:FKBP-type peptidyl-prolyl cis-trans isomerase FklB
MQKTMLFSAALMLGLSAAAQNVKKPVKSAPKPAAKPIAKTTISPSAFQLKSGMDSLSYAIGLNVGGNLKAQGVENFSYEAMNEGMRDAVTSGKKPLMDEQTASMTIQQKLQEYASKKINVQKEEGKKFLEENKKQAGITELPNGIQYKIIRQGSGIKPALEDTIKVHYKGTTIDGKVFDDSYSRGEPIEFPLGNLVEGWKQTLPLMPVGSKWQIFLPSDYGYGDRGAGGNIPGGATLIFELELLDVKPAKK